MSSFDTFEEDDSPAVGTWRSAAQSSAASSYRPSANGHPSLEADLARRMAEQLSDGHSDGSPGQRQTLHQDSDKRDTIVPAPDAMMVLDDDEQEDISCIPSLPQASSSTSNAVQSQASPVPRLQYASKVPQTAHAFGSIPVISGASARLPSTTMTLAGTAQQIQNGHSRKRKADVVDLTLSSDSNAGSSSGNDSDLQITGSVAPSIQVDDSPQFLGQINAVLLILHPVQELNLEAGENQLTPPPLVVTFNRPIPTPIGGRLKESVYVISNESGEKFGALEARVADVLGPVIGGKPFQDGRVQIRGYAMRQGKQATMVRLFSASTCRMLMSHLGLTAQHHSALHAHLFGSQLYQSSIRSFG